MRKLVKRPQAVQDIIEQSGYIAKDDHEIADDFLDAVEQTLSVIIEMPEAGSTKDSKDPKLAHLRMLAVKGFKKYLIFYLPNEDSVEIVRLFHAARDIEGLFTEEIKRK